VYRKDVLIFAYERCEANGGAAGVDEEIFEDIEHDGVERWLDELTQELKSRLIVHLIENCDHGLIRDMTNAVVVAKSGIEGCGVFAICPFRKGEPILAIDDSRVVNDHAPLQANEEERHCDYLERGRVVLMQPPERYINHSCNPNTYVKTVKGKRLVIARREIEAGEEVTYDYSINSSGDTIWLCRCDAARCRREIHSDFFHLPVKFQREYLPLLDDWFRREHAADLENLKTAFHSEDDSRRVTGDKS